MAGEFVMATIDRVLQCLNQEQIRATYGAVADVIGTSPQNVRLYLGQRRPWASWVVAARNGEPTGYAPHEKHPQLYRRYWIITTGADLREVLRAVGEVSVPEVLPPRDPAPDSVVEVRQPAELDESTEADSDVGRDPQAEAPISGAGDRQRLTWLILGAIALLVYYFMSR